MGCFPSNPKNGKVVDLSAQKTSGNASIRELKLTKSMLVQNELGDPFQIYEAFKLIGEGSYGKVYIVRHKEAGVQRAMKLISKKLSKMTPEKEKELIQEIEIIKKLDHPNILKVYEYYNTDKRLFIISELCTGGELFDKIVERKYFSEKQAAHIMKQILSAVYFCHLNNVIHRDLKPENILIETLEERDELFFSIKVIDFGTSSIYSKNKMLQEKTGTAYYIAPEVLKNSYNEKCDLWSCGVIMYILLSGVPPFYGEDDKEIFQRVLNGKYDMNSPVWDEVSPQAKNLISLLLEKDISKRLSAENAIKHKWFTEITPHKKNISNTNLEKVICNMRNYTAESKLVQATLAFIIHNMELNEEVRTLKKVFFSMDDSGDGRISKAELIKGLSKVMTPAQAESEVIKIMKSIDFDKNGYIEYEEFLRASYSKEKLLTEDNLKYAFERFDKDKNGSISLTEIKTVLGSKQNSKFQDWEKIIKELDSDGNGEISFDEFKKMMYKIIQA